MSIRDAKGNRLYKRVEIAVVYPEGVLKTERIVRKAPAGKGIGEDGVNELLMTVADQLETKFPWWEFEPIELASSGRVSKHVFSFKGYSTKSNLPKTDTEGQSDPVCTPDT